MNNTFSISEVFKQGWENTKKHIIFLVLSTLVYLIISTILNNLDKNGDGSFILGIVSAIVSYVFTIGMFKIALVVDSGGVPSVNDFKTDLRTFLNVLLGSLIMGFLIFTGIILIIIPGIIVAVRLSLTNWLIIDKRMPAWDAIKESWRLTKGFGWKIFAFGLIAVLLIVVSAIPFGLGLLISMPFIILSFAVVYKKIIGKEGTQKMEDVVTPPAPAPTPAEPIAPVEKEPAPTPEPTPEAPSTTVSTAVTQPPLIPEEKKTPEEKPEEKVETSERSSTQ